MKGDLIYELIGGIREEFILEAEPGGLADLLSASNDVSSPCRSAHPHRWRGWVALAASVCLVIGLSGGIVGYMLQSGGLSVPGWLPDWSLFPFLSPGETETQAESESASDSEMVTEVDGDPDTDTESHDPCAEGHDNEVLLDRAASCYVASRLHTVCRVCGYEQDVTGAEKLPHTYKDGFCTTCGLIEGAVGEYFIEVIQLENGETVGRLLLVNGASVDGTIVLPNVGYVEEYGLIPIRSIMAELDYMKPTRVIVPEGYFEVNWFLTDCDAVTEVVLPSTLKAVGYGSFKGCTSLTSIDLPESVEQIGQRAFSGCTGLTELHIPEGVAEIGQYAFAGCTALTELNLPQGVRRIEEGTFLNCKMLTPDSLPSGLTYIGTSAFEGCSAITSVMLPDGLREIGDAAFKHCYGLTDVDLPDGLTTLGKETFNGCTSLVSMRLPDGITVLPPYLFGGCSNLSEVNLPEDLTLIGEYAFSGTVIPTLRIPASVTAVGSHAFSGNTALTEAVFEGDSTTLEWYTFLGCSALKSVTLPSGLQELPSGVFADCVSLAEITLPDSLQTLGSNVFRNCSSLRELVIPDGVKTLCLILNDCTALERITLPAGLTKIETSQYLFSTCPNLREITMNGAGSRYVVRDSCLIDVESKTLLAGGSDAVIPTDGSVTVIGELAFANRSITTVIIPHGVTSIGRGAFGGCDQLAELHIPSTVTTLTETGLPGGAALETVYLDGNVAKWSVLTKKVNETERNYTVYCKNGIIHPDGSITLYEESN